jgi:hypothetical protein
MEHNALPEHLAISAQMDLRIGIAKPSRPVGRSLDGRMAHRVLWVLLARPVATLPHFGLVRFCTSVAESLAGLEEHSAFLVRPVETAAAIAFGKLALTARKPFGRS